MVLRYFFRGFTVLRILLGFQPIFAWLLSNRCEWNNAKFSSVQYHRYFSHIPYLRYDLVTKNYVNSRSELYSREK